MGYPLDGVSVSFLCCRSGMVVDRFGQARMKQCICQRVTEVVIRRGGLGYKPVGLLFSLWAPGMKRFRCPVDRAQQQSLVCIEFPPRQA